MTGALAPLRRTNMPIISKPFELTFGVHEGCDRCGRILFLDEEVYYVDEHITCGECVEEIRGNTAIGRAARRKRQP
jgi:hypothetical protein